MTTHASLNSDILPDALPLQVRQQLEQLTLEEKIGQLLIGGYENPAEIRPLIAGGQLGGIILFKRNIDTAKQTRRDIDDLTGARPRHLPPLLVSLDQEGGRVSRLPDNMGPFPAARELGLRNDRQQTRAEAARTAGLLKQLGFNLNYAPVLDIDSNPDNPVIADRAFGSKVQPVIDHGLAVIEGLRSQAVLPAAKHFPGHGDTHLDSHVDLPHVEKSLAELQEFELKPFQAAIADQVEMIMVAHIVVDALDRHPASLSGKLVDDLLRRQLGYDGVVITDDLTMGAVTEHYSLAEAAVMALEAGCDLLPVCHGIANQLAVYEAIRQAVSEGRLGQSRIDLSVGRILLLKHRWQQQNEKE